MQTWLQVDTAIYPQLSYKYFSNPCYYLGILSKLLRTENIVKSFLILPLAERPITAND